MTAQSGVSLIVVIVLLFVMTMLAMTTYREAVITSRVLTNTADQNRALRAAEAALLDAEIYAETRLSGLTGFNRTCNNGLCYAGAPGFAEAFWKSGGYLDTPGTSIELGAYTGAPPYAGVAEQPRYIIEGIKGQRPGDGDYVVMYRVTAKGVGRAATTVSYLQSVFVPKGR